MSLPGRSAQAARSAGTNADGSVKRRDTQAGLTVVVPQPRAALLLSRFECKHHGVYRA